MHKCPECGCACYCGGDIDDIEVGDEESVNKCNHCDLDADEDDEDDEFWDDDEDDEAA